MHSPSEALSDTDQFHDEISKHLSDIDLDTIYQHDESYIRSQISRPAAKDGPNFAKADVQHAIKQSSWLTARRKKRPFMLRGIHRAQTLAASIIDFLDSFSTIGDILKGIDPRAGGITYGTLYILFKIGHNKQQHEDLVTRALEDFAVMLNQIHQYHLAHLTEEKMLCYINEAYGDIIQFSRKASIYYSQSGFKRLWKTGVIHSGKTGLEKQSERVRSDIKHIVDEAAALMSRRVDICTRNMTYEHLDSLAAVRQVLQLTDVTASQANIVDACSNIYTPEIFTRISRHGRTILLQEANSALLSEAGLLDQFQSPSQSSLLLLSGTNYHSLPNTNGLCWLSPLTIELAKRATGPSAFYSTYHAGHIDSVKQRCPLTSLIDAVIYQLLVWDEDVARKCCGVVKRAACADAWLKEPIEARRGLVLELLNALAELPDVENQSNNLRDAKATTIVIDRLDAVSVQPERGGKRERPSGDELLEFVEFLLNIIGEAKGTVKAVVTMHSAFTEESRPDMRYSWGRLQKDWDKRWKKDRKSPLLLCKHEWEQGTKETKD